MKSRLSPPLRHNLLLVSLALFCRLVPIRLLLEQAKSLGGLTSLCIWDCYLWIEHAHSYNIENSYFFPTFPFLLKIVFALFPSVNEGLLSIALTNLLSLAAVFYAAKLAELLFPQKKNIGFLIITLISVFPGSMTWGLGHSEPLFFLFLVMGVDAFLRKRYWWSACAFGLLGISRPQGAWVVAAFTGVLFFFELLPRKTPRSIKLPAWKTILLGVIACLPIAIFCAWQFAEKGTPFYFIQLHKTWGRTFSVLPALADHLPMVFKAKLFSIPQLTGWSYFFVSWLAGLSFLRRKDPICKFLGISGILLAEIPLFFGGYYCFDRFTSVNLPLFLWLAEIISGKEWWLVCYLLGAIPSLAIDVMRWHPPA
jgi:hypothetical protein